MILKKREEIWLMALIEGFGSYPGIKRNQIYLHQPWICQRTGILDFPQALISLNSDSQSLKTNCYCCYYNLGMWIYNVFCFFYWSWCLQLLLYEYFYFFHYWSKPLISVYKCLNCNKFFYSFLYVPLKITSARLANQCSFEDN